MTLLLNVFHPYNKKKLAQKYAMVLTGNL